MNELPLIAHTVYRVPYGRITDQVYGALEKARDEGALSPLEGLVPEEHLDPARHILTGRKYLIFGPEQRDLMHPAALLRRAIEHGSAERLDMIDTLARITDAVRASDLDRRHVAPLRAASGFDHGLPSWMTGEEGPAVLSPDERVALGAALAEALTLDALTGDPDLLAQAQALGALVSRCDEPVADSYRDGDVYTLAACARRVT